MRKKEIWNEHFPSVISNYGNSSRKKPLFKYIAFGGHKILRQSLYIFLVLSDLCGFQFKAYRKMGAFAEFNIKNLI
jgi:hypothetical protein